MHASSGNDPGRLLQRRKKGLMRLWLSESLEGIAAVKKLQRSWVPRLRRSWSSSIKGCPATHVDAHGVVLHKGLGMDDLARTFSSLLVAEVDKRNLNPNKQMKLIEQLRH
ncbi:hypothetical protein Tco_1291359 [Tanacetum coccineum]